MIVKKICEEIKMMYLKMDFIDKISFTLSCISSLFLCVLVGSLLDTTVLHDNKIVIYYILIIATIGNNLIVFNICDYIKLKMENLK